MKKNLYYAHVFGRTNAIKEFIYNFFLAIASWPRLILEVFLRKNMGERYFSFSNVVLMLLILCYLPFPISQIKGAMQAFSPNQFTSGQVNPGQININSYMQSLGAGSLNRPQMPQQDSGQSSNFLHVLTTNITWYVFLAGVLFFALKRRKEVERLPSVFDFARFSLSTGNPYQALYNLPIGKQKADIRLVSTIIEPGICLVIGLVLIAAQQIVGDLIVICSVIYSLSYFAAYHIGDNYIMDKIDEIICNEDLKDSLVEGREPLNDRGFNFEPKMPNDPEFKRKVYESFFEEEESTEAI